jgi:flagellin
MELSGNIPSSSLSTINRLEQEKREEEEQLASGRRINNAADDPAGLQISSRLSTEINSAQQSSVNAQDQINQNNIQSGSLSAINEGLQRANELSVQSGSPLSDTDAIQGELDQISEQINTVANEVFGVEDFITGLDASDPAATQQILAESSVLLSETATAIGAQSNALSNQVSTYETSVVNLSASRSRIADTDFASTTNEQQQAALLLQSAVVNKKDEEARKGLLINAVV